MNALEIITALKNKKVIPRLEGDQLKLVGETKNLSSEFIELIKAQKNELILFLKNSMDQSSSVPVTKIAREAHYPASNAQERIWILSQFEGGSAAYNIVTSLYLKGTVIKENLEIAFRQSISNHESLRTVFAEVDGELRQVILEEIDFCLEFKDIRTSSNYLNELQNESENLSNWNFSLKNGPLIKVGLVRISEDEYALFLGIHHIISDGWSVGVMVQEVMKSYEASCKKEENEHTVLRIHYKDYTNWLSQRLAGVKGEGARTFWKDQFHKELLPLSLPYDFPRPAVKTFEGAFVKFYFDLPFYTTIQNFCKEQKVTSFNFFRSVLNILLYKFSGQTDIVIGTPVAGRNHIEFENQIGLYVNTIPLRSEINPEDTYLDFLKQISENSLRAFEFQEYPIDKIIEDLDIKRDISRNPLFDIMMVFQNTAIADGTININKQYGFDLQPLDGFYKFSDNEKRAAKFDLNFNFDNESSKKYFLEIEYSTKLFSRESIVQFYEAFIYLITQITDVPSIPVRSLKIVNSIIQDKILNVFNSPIEKIWESSITGLLTEKLELFKHRTAILTDKQTITYQQLTDYTDRTCTYLLSNYASNEKKFIGLLIGRSEWTIISILGILKSGDAYVPIDPAYPPSRIAYIIDDANIDFLVVDETGSKFVPEQYKGKLIHIDEFRKSASGLPDTFAVCLQESPAYLIYTSGSTGKPKGVEICHRNTIAFLKWAVEEFNNTDFDILYATTSYCFDLSVFEFLLPLLLGKQIRILSSALEIPDYIGGDSKVFINTVPSVIRSLLGLSMNWHNVKAINMAGEPISRRIKDELNFSAIEVRNLYGPSEDTTYSTVYRFEDDIFKTIPIGRPVGFTHAYIMDQYFNLLPVGMDGEIYLSGQSVANGYHNLPDLTHQKFVPNPFLEGMTMYKTGDIGKWLPDGNLEFTGRTDDQVKIRGFRIELGEIQYLLENHKLIKSAVVVVQTLEISRIVAYWVGAEELKDEILRNYLSKFLPAYMIPEYWVKVDKIPLNANGKVDVKQLPSLNDKVQEEDIKVPQNILEENLLCIWKEVLNVQEFGITQNFFDLGGYSLKAVRLRSLILNNLQKDLTLNEIFEYPTIREQAGILELKSKTIALKIDKAEKQVYYPISFSQERLWVLTNFEDASKAYHMPAAFKVLGDFDIEKLNQAFIILIGRHEILRTIFNHKNDTPVQVIKNKEAIAFQIEELFLDAELSEEEELMYLQKRWLKPFDLEHGPLLNCFLVKTNNNQILSFNMHHIISDGWSVTVLYKDIINIYRNLIEGGSGELKPLNLQFKDFAVWQRGQMSGANLEAHRDFWHNIFSEEIPALELPVDFYRPDIKTYNGGSIVYHIDNSLSDRVNQLSVSSGVSLFMTLMACVNVFLKKYANQNDIIIGTPMAGREQEELYDQIGFYVNTLAIRTKINPDNSFLELLSQQKQILLACFEHQNFPFEMLVDELKLKRDLSRSTLFDVMVVLQNLEGLSFNDLEDISSDLKLQKLTIPTGIAKYDLTFNFYEDDKGIIIELEYNRDLFKKDTIKRMVDHFSLLLEQVAHDPEIFIKDISLLSSDEAVLIDAVLDETKAKYNETSTITSLFENAVKTFPDRISIVCDQKQITYKELDLITDNLAVKMLRIYKVQPGELVLLHFERSEWMIIGILATLKAGAAYVPVDPSYPQSRKEYIAGDTAAKLLLFDVDPGTEFMDKINAVTCLSVPEADYSEEKLYVTVHPSDLAYIIYSSGTTGIPKGVLIEHKNVTRLLFTENSLFDFNQYDRWTLFHSYCFDFSVWEMYGALLYGGTLVIVPKYVTQNSILFYDFLKDNRVTVLNQTPTAFRSLVYNNSRRFSVNDLALRYLIFGGEALMPELLKEWKVYFPECRNINMYGITETTVHVTYKEISVQDINENKSNIGVPLPTLSCNVLDIDLRQAPIGVIGELCVGGAGVARGYLNKQDLTEQKFITLEHLKGKRFYRSGDFARILPSGDMEYIGRKDDQIKIRGHRIEISEIEIALGGLAEVSNSVVIPHKNTNGEFELVAYYTPSKEGDQTTIRTKLSRLLPSYMIPSYFITLDQFPLNRNGKLDKEALPSIDKNQLKGSSVFVAARNDIDRQIILIWEDILGIGDIGIRDNFFELGGHSLKATRVISKLNELLGVRIDLRSLFVDPTVEYLSNYIETILWMEKDEALMEGSDEEIIF